MDQRLILNFILKFIMALYGESSYPRKIVQEFIEFLNSFIREAFLKSLKSDVISILKSNGIEGKCLTDIETCFGNYMNVCDDFLTETRRFNILGKIGFFMPEEFSIGEAYVRKLVNDKMKYVLEECHGIRIPLKKTFKVFLETPGTFKAIINYINSLKEEKYLISNIMQCKVWLEKYSLQALNIILLPFYLFWDEFECGNPLAGQAGKNKFAAIYASLACLPEKLASKLESIIFSTLIPVPDKKILDSDEGSNAKMFELLIEEINELQRDGIVIDVDGEKFHVKFQLVLILRDNLGFNDILGFVESFHTSYCCRICKATLSEIQNLTVENPALLRTKENYALDILKSDPTKTGVTEECIFHKVDGYHFLDCVSVDLLHDFLEGVLAYLLFALVKHFVLETDFFDLEYLNSKIKQMNFGSEESYNKPSPISLNRLKENTVLKMSASETLTFAYFFGIMVGDRIPKDDEYWQLYVTARKILDIVMSPRIIPSDPEDLTKLIDKNHKMYKKLIGSLTPKFHNMIHYPNLLLKNGPFVRYWSMCYEGNHQNLKKTTCPTAGTVNLKMTIAKKQALKMCEMFNSLQNNTDVLLGSQVDNKSHSSIINSENYNSVEISGIKYKVGMFVVVDR